ATAAAAAVGASPLETGRSDTDVVVALDRSASEGEVYPVVLVSYLAACGTYADANVATLVKSYLSYVVSESGQAAAAANAGSAPLTSDPTLAAKAAAAVAAIN
ncbi:MAG: phosphate ABC transporter substrate-binding protein PstS, partial [Propionibacteriaceae bacterium]|nr:phosphate ABC transporter substrate-binding protein PstS [Propionibacteriaceae bacterium]